MTEVESDITFEDAIATSESLLEQMSAGELSPTQIEAAIANLVQSENGARGFFVNYLTSEGTLADSPSPEVVQALRSNPEIVGELLVKNAAMSAATRVAHQRDENEALAQQSQQVCDRSTTLIKLVQLDAVYKLCKKLLETAVTGEGSYKAFIERWGYDAQQRQVIAETMESLLGDYSSESESETAPATNPEPEAENIPLPSQD